MLILLSIALMGFALAVAFGAGGIVEEDRGSWDGAWLPALVALFLGLMAIVVAALC